MKKIFFSYALFLLVPFLFLNSTPPFFPSSSYSFAQKAQPTTSNQYVNFETLPCFRAYEALQKFLRYPTSIVTPQELLSKVSTKTITPQEAHKQFVADATKMIYLATDMLQKNGSYNN